MSNIEHCPEDHDGTDDWRPFDQRKWSRVELLAEIDALNAEVAKWVGIATERRGAVSDHATLRDGLIELRHDLEAGEVGGALSRIRDLLDATPATEGQ